MAGLICGSVSARNPPCGMSRDVPRNSRSTWTSIRCAKWVDISALPGCWLRNSAAH